MHDDALKELWRAQSLGPAPALPDEDRLAEMKRKVKGLDRTLFWRDCRENIAAVFVMACFGLYFFIFPALLARAGCVIVILSGLLVIAYPIWRKRRVPKAAPDASLMQSLECELRKVEVEIALLRSVHGWYILPGAIGVLIFFWGIIDSMPVRILLSLFVVALDAGICWLNQVAADKRLRPLKQELESLLRLDGAVPPPEIPRKYLMTKIILLGSILTFLGTIGYLAGRDTEVAAGHYTDPTAQMLDSIRVQHKFPALAAAVIVEGKTVATNAVGFRRHGSAEAVTADDKFHLGSVTKSMTATVAAMLVEQGKMSWTTTIGESLPEFANEIHADYLGVTLEQLLAHRGGAPASPPVMLWRQAWAAKGTPGEQRLEFVKGLLARKPEAAPGTRKIYSNQGYAIAGVMLERAGGKPWEELMRSMLFEPLGMETAGFGAPAALGQVDQPWGHSKKSLLGIQAVPPGPRADNPAAIGPAGTVHCSLGDLAKYAAFHLAGARGESKLLKPETFKKLHAPVGEDDYALGWIVLERRWAGGRALMHNGSNTMFYIVVWMAPERNCAVMVATNAGGDGAFAGCDAAAGKLIQEFFSK